MGSKVRITEVIYEIQKKTSLLQWQWRYHEFIDADGHKTTFDTFDRQIPSGWIWLDEWKHDGVNAWEYSNRVWSSLVSGGNNLAQQAGFSTSETAFDTIRRRRWTRNRVKSNVSHPELEELKRRYRDRIKVISEDTVNAGMNTYKQQLRDILQNVAHSTKKPNILLLGGSGAGKSSLVNAVFGKPLAEIGEGKPVTQHYTKFAGHDIPVVIYDSKGIEHGSIENGFIADTYKFFRKLRQTDLQQHIHCVWYVIDLTQARFQPFEAEFCRKHLEDIPIIFVFNKADAVKPEIRDAMLKTVADFKLPNCRGLFATVADCKNFDRKDCPHCGSLKIRKRLKEGTCTIMCKECQQTSLMTKTLGIEELSRATLEVMPDLIHEAFAVAHKTEMLGLQQQAKGIINKWSMGASFLASHSVNQNLSSMTRELVSLYKLDVISQVATQAVLKKFQALYSDQRWHKRALTALGDGLWNKKHSQAQALLVLSGLEICRLLIQFRRQIVAFVIEEFELEEQRTKKQASDATPDSPVSPAAPNPQNGNASTHSFMDLDWSIEKLIANMRIDIDSNQVNSVMLKLKGFGGLEEYLSAVQIDGSSQYLQVEPKYLDQQGEEYGFADMADEEEIVAIHNYQTHGRPEQSPPKDDPRQQEESSK